MGVKLVLWLLDACLVDRNDRSPYLAFVNLPVGWGVSRLFNAEFYDKIDIRCGISKWNHFNIDRRSTNWSLFACTKNCYFEIPYKFRRCTKEHRRVCGNAYQIVKIAWIISKFLSIRWIFQRMVCHGQHTYVYSQVLIQVLSQEPKGGFNMKRLSQEITKYALQKWVIWVKLLISK